jgi:hypothetical protein
VSDQRTSSGGQAIGGTGRLDKQGEAGGCRDAYDQKGGKK